MVVEVSEIKSYKLSDDGNMVTIMMKDGTVHNNLIFLDEGFIFIIVWRLEETVIRSGRFSGMSGGLCKC